MLTLSPVCKIRYTVLRDDVSHADDDGYVLRPARFHRCAAFAFAQERRQPRHKTAMMAERADGVDAPGSAAPRYARWCYAFEQRQYTRRCHSRDGLREEDA